MWKLNNFKKLNIADWFSVYRIIAVPWLIAIIFLNKPMWFAPFLLISLSTDMIDGYLARKYNLISERGAQLDSVGDALTFIVGFVGLFYFKFDFVKDHALPILIVFGVYVLQLGLAYWRYGMPSSFHTYLAKTAALFQGVFMVLIFYIDTPMVLFYTVIFLSLIETIEEIVLIGILPEWTANVKGLWWVLKDKRSTDGSTSRH